MEVGLDAGLVVLHAPPGSSNPPAPMATPFRKSRLVTFLLMSIPDALHVMRHVLACHPTCQFKANKMAGERRQEILQTAFMELNRE